jgi:hypothetical protein
MAPVSSRREAERRACDPLLRRCRTVVRCSLLPGEIARTCLIAGHVIQPCWRRLWVSQPASGCRWGYEPHDAGPWRLACSPTCYLAWAVALPAFLGAYACLVCSARSEGSRAQSVHIAAVLSVFAGAATRYVPVKPPERGPDHWTLVPASGHDFAADRLSGTAQPLALYAAEVAWDRGHDRRVTGHADSLYPPSVA